MLFFWLHCCYNWWIEERKFPPDHIRWNKKMQKQCFGHLKGVLHPSATPVTQVLHIGCKFLLHVGCIHVIQMPHTNLRGHVWSKAQLSMSKSTQDDLASVRANRSHYSSHRWIMKALTHLAIYPAQKNLTWGKTWHIYVSYQFCNIYSSDISPLLSNNIKSVYGSVLYIIYLYDYLF